MKIIEKFFVFFACDCDLNHILFKLNVIDPTKNKKIGNFFPFQS
jgi:hypothetical protein